MSKFITLTKSGGNDILINTMMVTAMELVPAPGSESKTRIHVMSGESWIVSESPEDIIKKMKAADSYTITWTNTGPR